MYFPLRFLACVKNISRNVCMTVCQDMQSVVVSPQSAMETSDMWFVDNVLSLLSWILGSSRDASDVIPSYWMKTWCWVKRNPTKLLSEVHLGHLGTKMNWWFWGQKVNGQGHSMTKCAKNAILGLFPCCLRYLSMDFLQTLLLVHLETKMNWLGFGIKRSKFMVIGWRRTELNAVHRVLTV